MKRLFALGFLLLSGCASIPLSTMARFGGFDEAAFSRIEPTEVLVRVVVPEEFAIDPAQTFLTVSISSPQVESKETIPLALVYEDSTQLSGGWFAQPVRGRRQTLRLTEPGIKMFRDVQRAAAAKQINSGAFTVKWTFRQEPADAKEARLWVDLQLSQQDGFFPLIRDARIPFSKGGG